MTASKTLKVCAAVWLVACGGESDNRSQPDAGVSGPATNSEGGSSATSSDMPEPTTGAPVEGSSGSSGSADPDSSSSSDSGADTEPVAGLLFSEDFDGRSDWLSTGVGSCANAGSGCQSDVPEPWDLMYLDQPSVAMVGPTCEISAQGAIGGRGKGVRFVDDARGRKNAWKADCQLMKHLGETFPDLYFRFDLEWNPDMTMDDFNAAKIFRAGYYLPGYFDGSASGGVFSTSDTTRGIAFIDIQRRGSAPDYEAMFKVAYRCDPGYKQDCRGTSDELIGDWQDTFADGQPHTVVFRMKTNTGNATDGVFQAWWDGDLIVDEQAVQWTTAGEGPGGFNTFSIGGNQDHNWGCGGGSFPDDEMCDDESQEWKHNIDNVKVGTTWESVQ